MARRAGTGTRLWIAAIAVGLVLNVWLAARWAGAQVRPTCSRVMAEVHRNISLRRGSPAGAVAVAKELGTELAWVHRCMEVYGRVPAARRGISDSERAVLQEALEEGLSMEEVQELHDLPPPPMSDEERSFRRADRPRPLKGKRQPTPYMGNEFGPGPDLPR